MIDVSTLSARPKRHRTARSRSRSIAACLSASNASGSPARRSANLLRLSPSSPRSESRSGRQAALLVSPHRAPATSFLAQRHARLNSLVGAATDVSCAGSCPILTFVRVVPTPVEGRCRRSIFLYAVPCLRRCREDRQGRAETYCDDEDFSHIYLLVSKPKLRVLASRTCARNTNLLG